MYLAKLWGKPENWPMDSDTLMTEPQKIGKKNFFKTQNV